MARTKTDIMVAREAVVVVVGARPIQYGTVTVQDRRTAEMVTIPNQNVIADPGDEGTPYVFSSHQKVRADHPAVEASPGAFMPIGDLDEDVHQAVTATN